jgi:hypothetical protein
MRNRQRDIGVATFAAVMLCATLTPCNAFAADDKACSQQERANKPPSEKLDDAAGDKLSSENMLKLVESLATKAERAKATSVEFSPLQSWRPRSCDWCEKIAANPRGWASYGAFERGRRGSVFRVTGDVCSDPECRISIQARYSATEA